MQVPEFHIKNLFMITMFPDLETYFILSYLFDLRKDFDFFYSKITLIF